MRADLFLTKVWKSVYDNEEGGAGGDGDGAGGDGGGGTVTKPKLSDLIQQHGLQDELNTMMADNRKKLTKQNQELVTQLKQIRETVNLTAQQKEELESRIEQLQEQYMTKEELAKRQNEKQTKEHQLAVEKLTSERDKWNKMYSDATVTRSLQDAAIEGDAFRPEQIVAMLGPSTHLTEVLDSTGQPTGKYQPMVKFNDINADGEPVILELNPKDAIKRMKELPEAYGNLFKGSATGGIGGTGGSGSEQMSNETLDAILKDPVKYKEWRKKNPNLDISKLRRKR